jgi:hypothetical protein
MKELNDFREFLNEDEESTAPIRKQIYQGMNVIDSALAKGRGIIPQDKWDALYAAVTKVEDIAETL